MKIAALTFRDFHIPFFTIYYTRLFCPLLRSGTLFEFSTNSSASQNVYFQVHRSHHYHISQTKKYGNDIS